MKRLILCAMLFALCASAADWGKFESGKEVINGYEVSMWFCECDVSMLDQPIPQDVLDYVYGVSTDEQGGTIHNKTDLKLRDFTLRYWLSLDGTKAIVLLGAREFDVGRMLPVGLPQIQMWESYLTPYGYGFDQWTVKTQLEEKLNSSEYKEGLQ